MPSLPSPSRRRRARSALRGAVTLEIALGFGIFVFMLLAVVDVSWIFFRRASLQHGIREAARVAMTGRTNPAAILANIRRFSGVTLQTTDLQVSAIDGAGRVTPDSSGHAGDVVTVAVQYQLPVLGILARYLPHGRFAIQVATSYKNESF